MRMLVWTLLLWLAFVGASVPADRVASGIQHLEGGYSIEVPTKLTMTPGHPMPDFALYRVANSAGKELLLLYLGDHPDTRSASPPNSERSSTSIGGHPATLIRWTGEGGTYFGSTQIQLKNASWPLYADMRFGGLSKSEKELVERIIVSFRASDQHK